MKQETSDYKNVKDALTNAGIKFSTAHVWQSEDFILILSERFKGGVKLIFDKNGKHKETV